MGQQKVNAIDARFEGGWLGGHANLARLEHARPCGSQASNIVRATRRGVARDQMGGRTPSTPPGSMPV